MPKDGATTRAQLADRTLNPTRNVAGGSSVTIVLTLATGVSFNPEDVYDALVVKYGAGKVSSDRDVQSMGGYHFRIIP